ncbi:hypothetical protein [Actinocorallia lasiicapitis]
MKRALAIVATTAALVSLPGPAFAAAPELRTVPLPFLWPQAGLLDVTADGAGGVWVGGMQGGYCLRWADHCWLYSAGNPVVRRWVGTSWEEYPLNGWTGQGQISQVASSAGETWITGGPNAAGGSNVYAARFDGSAFQKVAIPAEHFGMLATSAAGTFVTAFDGSGEQLLLKRTGGTWTEVQIPGMRYARDIQGLSATDVWAVGTREAEATFAHFDGTAWTNVPLPAGTSGWSEKVVPVAANDVWAITQGNLMRWNGSVWTLIPSPPEITVFSDLTVDASGTPWVAAVAEGTGTRPYRYIGGVWEAVTVPSGATVHDVASVPGGIWGVGWRNDAPAAYTGS